jgi:hypothetical protein
MDTETSDIDDASKGAHVKRFVSLSVVAIVMLVMLPASATHEVVQDSNDVKGHLDLRRIEMKEGPRRWLISVRRGFNADHIYDKGYFLIYLDTFGDDRFDYYVLLRSVRDRIKGDLWRDKQKKNDEVVASTRVWRRNDKTVVTTVPFGKIRHPKSKLDYRWHVRTLWSGPTCREICIDRAPNGRSVTELFVQPPG